MYDETLKDILQKYKDGTIDMNDAVKRLNTLPYEDIGFAKIDYNREVRRGYPEVIYCEGKTPEQVRDIAFHMYKKGSNVMGTRASKVYFDAIKKVCPNAEFFDTARIIAIKNEDVSETNGIIGIVAAGTSDMPVAEEAAITAELMGNKVKRFYDVGVAGLHRLLDNINDIRLCRVIVCIAGMEGALPTVLGGLVKCPIIAVPTSIGYGANFHGLSALLAMLNSCTSGVTVVNIDNGFGAAYAASLINKIGE